MTTGTGHLKVGAHVLVQLGSELVTDSEQAILECVKNSYDADAPWCRIEIDTKEAGTAIETGPASLRKFNQPFETVSVEILDTIGKPVVASTKIAADSTVERRLHYSGRIFAKANVDEEGARVDLEEALGDLASARVDEIRRVFFEKEASEQGFSTKELSDKAVEKIYEVLGVKPEGRWTFDKAAEEIDKVEGGSDEGTTYIVDLNEAGGSGTRGLDILQQLKTRKSKGNAFILTHDATTATEGEKETQLRGVLDSEAGDPIRLPVCVIAKERLFDYENEDVLSAGLVVGVKRAALRRSVFDVIDRMRGTIKTSFEGAAEQLLSVPPEQLEVFVFERGYMEGIGVGERRD